MEKTVKFRMFNYFVDTGRKDTAGNPVLQERTANFGETIDVPREEDIERGERLGAFFSDEQVKAIKDGTYRGPHYDSLRTNRTSLPMHGQTEVTSLDETNTGELPTPEQVKEMDSEDLAELISERRLTVDQTLALAGTDKDAAEKVLDAEGIATEGDPRKGVEGALEKVISDATSGANS